MVAAAVFAGLCLALLWRLIDMPVWRTPQGVYKCPAGPVYAGANDPCCPIGSSLSPSPSVAPSVSPSPSVAPSVSPSPSVAPSVSPSPSVAPSPSPSTVPFPGPGDYCVYSWLAPEQGGCAGLTRDRGTCVTITTQAQWDLYQFGVCIGPNPPDNDYTMNTVTTGCYGCGE